MLFLSLTDIEFDQLHKAIGEKRGKEVVVPKALLVKLLKDHSKALGKVIDLGGKYSIKL